MPGAGAHVIGIEAGRAGCIQKVKGDLTAAFNSVLEGNGEIKTRFLKAHSDRMRSNRYK